MFIDKNDGSRRRLETFTLHESEFPAQAMPILMSVLKNFSNLATSQDFYNKWIKGKEPDLVELVLTTYPFTEINKNHEGHILFLRDLCYYDDNAVRYLL